MTQNQDTNYQSPPIGQEISCVMQGIGESLLNNNERLKEILLTTLNDCNFGIIKTIKHEYTPQGFAIIVLLSESRAEIHTYPEHRTLYFSIYSCRGPKDAEKPYEIIKEKLNPTGFLYLKKDEIPVKK